jgi:hypothetical protein
LLAAQNCTGFKYAAQQFFEQAAGRGRVHRCDYLRNMWFDQAPPPLPQNNNRNPAARKSTGFRDHVLANQKPGKRSRRPVVEKD